MSTYEPSVDHDRGYEPSVDHGDQLFGTTPVDDGADGDALIINKDELYVIKFGMENYLTKLKSDFSSQFDGNEKYSIEDDMFLAETIHHVARLLFKLQEHGIS